MRRSRRRLGSTFSLLCTRGCSRIGWVITKLVRMLKRFIVQIRFINDFTTLSWLKRWKVFNKETKEMSENMYWSHQNHVSQASSRFDSLNLVSIFVRAWYVRTLGSKKCWRLVCNQSSVLSSDVWRGQWRRVRIFGDHGWRNGIGHISRTEQLFLEKGIDDKEKEI